MVRLRALFLLFSLKEDFHGLIFIFVFVWVLYESWEIKNRGLVGIVGKEKMKEMQKMQNMIFAFFAFDRTYVCMHATKNNAIDDVRVRTHASEQCDR